MRFLLLPLLGNRLNPWTVCFALFWQSSLVVLFGYLLILPFALLGGLNLAGTTLAYFADVYPVLSPLAEVAISHWLFYSYFHYALAPIVGFLLQGSASTFLTLLALSPIALVWGPAVAGGMFDLAFDQYPTEYFHNSKALMQSERLGQPAPLPTGWMHGHHPPILYEHSPLRFVVRRA